MNDHNGSAIPRHAEAEDSSEVPMSNKGKGKAIEPPQDVSMGEEEEEDDTSEDEVDDNAPIVDDADEDNMEEIDLDNIIPDGRRTRGRQIDFAKAAEELPADDDDEDDDDEDFEEPSHDDRMDD